MTKKWKIFGQEFEWYDVKTKFKQLLRKLTYSRFVQELICLIISSYMRLVYASSRKILLNFEVAKPFVDQKKPLIFCLWHNRLMMMPFVANKIMKDYAKKNPDFHFMSLASKHGDGRFVGRTMEMFGLMSILGSTKDKRKSSRGIEIGSLKRIFGGLKKGYFIGITPDGPRGPNQQIGGEVVNIARLSGAALWPLSYSSSRVIELKSWDRFKIPLPFSTLCFYLDEKVIHVARDSDENNLKEISDLLAARMNFVQEKSLEIAIKK